MKSQRWTDRAFWLLPWAVLAVATGWMLWFPLVPSDNDLFYHLNGGRYLATTGSVYRDSFFSFLEPPRSFVVYYWLFQGLVFQLFSRGGYVALLVLRATIFGATLFLLRRFLWEQVKAGGSRFFLSATFGLCVGVLITRMSNIRPHLFSYLFLVLTLVLCESKGRQALKALPLLAVL